jgi:hypothetical protein
MSELDDDIKLHNRLVKYTNKYGIKSFLNLIKNALVMLSYYRWDKSIEGRFNKIIKELHLLINEIV